MEKLSRQRQYTFQLRKCDDDSCCIPATTPPHQLHWLPDPVLQEQDNDHYMPYEEAKLLETTEKDRPSLLKVPEAKVTGQKKSTVKTNLSGAIAAKSTEDEPGVPASMFTVQNAPFTVECIECRKPGVIYSKNKLIERRAMKLALQLSEVDYTCGSFITSEDDQLHGRVYVRQSIMCSSIAELAYYSSYVGKKICAASEQGEKDQTSKFQTVLPICQTCKDAGFEAVTQRPFGK